MCNMQAIMDLSKRSSLSAMCHVLPMECRKRSLMSRLPRQDRLCFEQAASARKVLAVDETTMTPVISVNYFFVAYS